MSIILIKKIWILKYVHFGFPHMMERGLKLMENIEQAGRTSMDAAGILNGILEFLHNHFLLT